MKNVTPIRKPLVFSIRVEIIKDRNAEPLPGCETQLGELITPACSREDEAEVARCLREAADFIDPSLWAETEYEGVYASVDNVPPVANDK